MAEGRTEENQGITDTNEECGDLLEQQTEIEVLQGTAVISGYVYRVWC